MLTDRFAQDAGIDFDEAEAILRPLTQWMEDE